MSRKFVLVFTIFFGLTLGAPVEDVSLKEGQELVSIEAKEDIPSHKLEMEHRTKKTGDLPNIQSSLVNSAVSTADKISSGIASVADGAVDTLGNLLVTAVESLPHAIRNITNVVGKAVNFKREKVLVLVKGLNLGSSNDQSLRGDFDKISSAGNSQIQNTIDTLQESIANLLGKLLGAAINNEDEINSAISDSVKALTGNRKQPKDELKILSRDIKDTNIVSS